MMVAAVEDALAGFSPIVVYENPKTWAEASHNTLAFSNEARSRNTEPPTEGSGFKVIDSFPRIPQCYGWLNFDINLLFNLDPKMRRKVLPDVVYVEKVDRMFRPNSNYIGVVYECIEDGENDNAITNVVLSLHLAGFHYNGTALRQNWKSGVLIDHSDIVNPRGFGWFEGTYKRMNNKFRLLD